MHKSSHKKRAPWNRGVYIIEIGEQPWGVLHAVEPGAATSPSGSRLPKRTWKKPGHSQLVPNLPKGALEHALTIAKRDSPRTTKLDDRPRDELSIDDVEGIKI
jgi:hypothetical protein